jgi:hypothetical protein
VRTLGRAAPGGRQAERVGPAIAPAAHAAFDYVRVEDGRIVDRVQQAEMFGQLHQLFAPLLVVALVVAAVVLLAVGALIGALAL